MKNNLTLDVICPRLLYWSWFISDSASAIPHKHPFWQIEVVVAGEIATAIDGEVFTLGDSTILVVPPENNHAFSKKHGLNAEVFSFKYDFDNTPADLRATIISDSDFSRHICSTLVNLLNENKKTFSLPAERQIALEYILGSIIHYCYAYQPQDLVSESHIVRELREYVSCHGKKVNVQSAAEHFNCSASFLKRHIKQEKGIPAKAFIDRECFEIIKKHLKYSNMKLTQIAKMMHFNDIYTLSRFFKRMSGISPSQYRMLVMPHSLGGPNQRKE